PNGPAGRVRCGLAESKPHDGHARGSSGPLGDSGVASMQAKASVARERWTIVAVGVVVIALGAAVLIGGLTNLAIAPAMSAARRQTADFAVPLSSLHSSAG